MMIWKKIKIPIINKYVWSNKWNITIKKEFTETNLKSLQKAFVYIESNLIDSDGGMYLTVDSLIEINYIIADSNKTALIKVNVKPYGFDKINLDKELIEDKLYQIIDYFNEIYICKVLFSTLKQNTTILWWEWLNA